MNKRQRKKKIIKEGGIILKRHRAKLLCVDPINKEIFEEMMERFFGGR